MPGLPRYAELRCLTNFSFLKGASHPEELVLRAIELGYAALAITDECSLAGVVRAHAEAKNSGLKLIIGASFFLEDGVQLVLLATNLEGYGNLSELITLGRMRCAKGTYRLTRADLDGTPQPADAIPEAAGTIDHLAGMPDCLALWIPAREADDATLEADARWIASTFAPSGDPQKPRAWIAVQRTHRMDDESVIRRLVALGDRTGLRAVATGDVHMHVRSRKPLQDTLTAIRLGLPVASCGDALAPNAERHLRSRLRLPNLFADRLLEETIAIADRCEFSMKELGYRYPREIVPDGQTQTSYLRQLTEEGLVRRFPEGVIDKVRRQIEHELTLIAELKYEAFFLTVHDIVRYARSVGILCQGRGSAANSAVCFCLGITEVNPALQEMLFERFLTKERNEPPDIDVDFEHQRREEVIQYIYDKYGRHRTALAATVIAYRTRSAIRDVGKALGLDAERVDRLSSSHAWWENGEGQRDRLVENGFDPDSPVARKLVELTSTLRSFPRHLSQHVGGFVISADKLSRMVPIENAAMQRPSDWDAAAGRRAIYEGAVASAAADDAARNGTAALDPAGFGRRGKTHDEVGTTGAFSGDAQPDVVEDLDAALQEVVREALEAESGFRAGEIETDAADGATGVDPTATHSAVATPALLQRPATFPGAMQIGAFPMPASAAPAKASANDPAFVPDPSRDGSGGAAPRDTTLFPTFRSVIQWDKDDLEELGLLKVDVLALGMLSAVRRSLDLIGQRRGRPFCMSDIPPEDPKTYDMICEADTVGVFQIESRAQMSMLPRMLPRTYYDLVVEVAIVRPGPIQGGMVHPYLKAREDVRNDKTVTYPSPAVEKALARTLGVPIFQEQVMQLMMLAADFSAGEADKLRRAMAAWKRKGGLGPFHDRIVDGMIQNGYEREYAERIFKQVEGFGEYGFPESHAASFAYLVYISCWIKRHEPAAFLAAMLNSQPLGFYSPSQLIQDAKRHDIEVRPIDVTISGWDAVLEEHDVANARNPSGATGASNAQGTSSVRGTSSTSSASGANDPRDERPQPAVRLGFNSIQSFNLKAATRLVAARNGQPFDSVEDLGRRAALSTLELDALAAADTLTALAGHRRQARWQAASHQIENDLMRKTRVKELQPALVIATEGREIVADYDSTGFTLRRHPLALLRPRLRRMNLLSAAELAEVPNGRFVKTTGIVTVRQRPGTAKGTIFVSLEDETGVINVIVWKHLIGRQRDPLLTAKLLTVAGRWQRQGKVCNIVAGRLNDDSMLMGRLALPSRDFH